MTKELGKGLVDRLYRVLPFAYMSILNKEVRGREPRSVLDVGTGTGKTFGRLRRLMWVSFSVGIDIHEPYVAQARAGDTHDYSVLAKASQLPFRDRSFDIVSALQLIEHLDKAEALIALGEMERVASRKVIITTPRGEYPQQEFDCNPHQAHRSAWDVSEMEALGYRVVLYGTRLVRYSGTAVNKLFAYVISLAGLLVSPSKTGGGMICVKDVREAGR